MVSIEGINYNLMKQVASGSCNSNMINLGVLVSGSGSNLQAIIDAIASNKLDANIKLVVCNKSKAKAVERAKKHNIPVNYSKLKHRSF